MMQLMRLLRDKLLAKLLAHLLPHLGKELDMDEAKKTQIRETYKINNERVKDIIDGEWVCNCGGDCRGMFLVAVAMPLERAGQAAMSYAFGEMSEEEFYATAHLVNLMLAKALELGEQKTANITQARADA